jgi:hypothetical protein
MTSRHKVFPGRELVVISATGTFDFDGFKQAVARVAADPHYENCFETLFDLRDVECELSTVDIYEMAALLAWPNPALPTRRKIAVLVSGERNFDRAKFLELCAANRGVELAAFLDIAEADDWLDAELTDGIDDR